MMTKKYRLLEVGEALQKGDWYNSKCNEPNLARLKMNEDDGWLQYDRDPGPERYVVENAGCYYAREVKEEETQLVVSIDKLRWAVQDMIRACKKMNEAQIHFSNMCAEVRGMAKKLELTSVEKVISVDGVTNIVEFKSDGHVDFYEVEAL